MATEIKSPKNCGSMTMNFYHTKMNTDQNNR